MKSDDLILELLRKHLAHENTFRDQAAAVQMPA